MDPLSDDTFVPPDREGTVAEFLTRFREAWARVTDPKLGVELDRYLPEKGSPLRALVLGELIQIDIENRAKHGEVVEVDAYLAKYPELVRPNGQKPAPKAEYFDTLKKPEAAAGDTCASDKPPSPAPGNQGPTQIGEYKLVKCIGRGGFGEVWQAEAPGGVEVAMKIIFRPLDDEDAQRELQALELIKRLRHPYLLQTQAFYPQEDRLRVVMELADASLRDRLKECRKEGLAGIPPKELITYFREAAEALDYLHSEGVLHRDIKPENILLLKRHAKLADFGLARFHDQQRSVSVTGSGTPAYMSPEVWKGKVSKLSDQYSLAVTYAELRLDRRPFSGDMAQIIFEHLESKPDLAPLPEAEQQVILRALAKDPHQRYDSCLEFATALEQVMSQPTPPGAAPRVLSAAPRTAVDPALSAAPRRDFETLGTKANKDLLVNTNAQGPFVSATAIGGPGLRGKNQAGWRKTEADPLAPEAEAPASRAGFPWPVIAVVMVFGLGVAGVLVSYRWGLFAAKSNQIDSEATSLEKEVDFLPRDSRKAAGAEIISIQGKKYYSEIERNLPGGRLALFVLIPKKRTSDPETFYILRNKVSAGMFRDFAIRYEALLKDDQWKKGGQKAGEDLGMANDELPAFRIVVEDAYLFASKWMGGNLPTVRQWDKAAGRFEGVAPIGPYETDWTKADDKDKTQIAVNRGKEGPMTVGRATKDVSFFGVRDMAGNGRELTRELFAPEGNEHEVPLQRPANSFTDRVLLRGRSYLEPEPLKFQDPRLNARPDAVGYSDSRPDITFRVVLEAPPPSS